MTAEYTVSKLQNFSDASAIGQKTGEASAFPTLTADLGVDPVVPAPPVTAWTSR